MPERHGCNLGVEKRVGDLAGEIVDDLKILASRMEDLQDILIPDEHVEQRLEIDPLSLRVDRRSLFRACHLDQAEVRPVGILAHELRVHGDKGLGGKAVDKSLEVARLRNQRMDAHGLRGFSRALAG